MDINRFQLLTLQKILKHDKSFIFWPRVTGKTHLTFKYLENYIMNNHNQDILFLCYKQSHIKYIMQNLYYHVKFIPKRNNEVSFINSNYLIIDSINSDYVESVLHINKPSLIIFDEIYEHDLKILQKISLISKYINYNNCKCLFMTTNINMQIVDILDVKNDFYINLAPSICNIDSEYLINFNTKNFSHKPTELFDFNDIKYQRKIKLQKIKELSYIIN